jgi:hypothetical protein
VTKSIRGSSRAGYSPTALGATRSQLPMTFRWTCVCSSYRMCPTAARSTPPKQLASLLSILEQLSCLPSRVLCMPLEPSQVHPLTPLLIACLLQPS